MRDESSGDFAVYATLADAEAGVTATGNAVRGIRCNTAGTLRVAKSYGGGVVDLPFLAGETQWVSVRGISETGSSGCVPITVFR